MQLAGMVIGTSIGQTESASTSFELPYSSPPVGEWHFVLMLREWTAAGYVTRDFTNFITPVIYGLAPAAMPPQTVTLVPAKAAPLKPTVPEKAVPTRLLQDVAVTSASKKASAPAKTLTSKGEHRAPIAPVAAKVADGVARSVSVNTAFEGVLAAVEGLSTKLARAIIRKRPFTSLNDLRQVKGISASLLTKIHSRLRL
jgi:DNA uptake protein ComE-like DNA-binding protein